MFILKKGHQPGVYVPLRALFLVLIYTRQKFKLVLHCYFYQAQLKVFGLKPKEILKTITKGR